MEQAAVQQAFELWGPVGGFALIIVLGQWYALKWLAERDNKRSEKQDTLLEKVTAVVANNTAAMEEMRESHDSLRDVILGQRKPATITKLNGVARRA